MLRALISGAAKFRLAMLAIEMALPSGKVLKRRFNAFLAGVVAAIAGGVLASLLFAAAICAAGYALYYYSSLSVFQAVAITVAVFMAVVAILISYGMSKVRNAFNALEDSDSFSFKRGDGVIDQLVNGFLEGLLADESPKPPETDDKVVPIKKAV